ncbi:hypothetical protein [Micromonospora rubida]|uniref:hypothetical protein n=1 Tax=Micromonospora rubida TaxID=2697657 RepID=UPI001377224A|nr:hypothetical protein [Micromonospora rubida]NBE83147.1 hypothetical protein [Micromonospora rubida]
MDNPQVPQVACVHDAQIAEDVHSPPPVVCHPIKNDINALCGDARLILGGGQRRGNPIAMIWSVDGQRGEAGM